MGNTMKKLMFAACCTLLAAPMAAQAQTIGECAENADCGDGYACEVVGSDAPGCMTIDCPPGAVCDPIVACDASVAEDVMGCVPKDCEADADCGDSAKCVEATISVCPEAFEMPGCMEGDTACMNQKPADTSCTTTTTKTCTPNWALPCVEAADCGAGFECVQEEQCSTPGSTGGGSSGTDAMGAAPQDAGAADMAQAAPLPTCEKTDEYSCKLVETPCETNSDCTDGLICNNNPNAVTCGGDTTEPAQPMDQDGGAANSGGAMLLPQQPQDAGADMPVDAAVAEVDSGTMACGDSGVPARICMPQSYWYGNYSLSVEDGHTTSNGTEDVPAVDEGTDKGADAGVTGAGENTDNASDAMSKDGCSAAPGRASGSGWLWSALAMAWLARRRRSAA